VTSLFIFFVTQLNAPRGTDVAMVGTRASCQPIPVLSGAGVLYRFCQHHGLFPAAAVGNQVDHGQAVDDDEIFADGLPRALDNLEVGVGDQEFVDEIAFRAHDLDAVVAGLARKLRAAHKIAYLFFHAGSR
jgi:hypothetical protein